MVIGNNEILVGPLGNSVKIVSGETPIVEIKICEENRASEYYQLANHKYTLDWLSVLEHIADDHRRNRKAAVVYGVRENGSQIKYAVFTNNGGV